MIQPITRLSSGPKHHFFGYYGINPWDGTGQLHLALETDFHEHRPVVGDSATVGTVNRSTGEFNAVGKTSAFNLQQGAMMHWVGNGVDEEITYNDWENGRVVARAVHPATGSRRTIDSAIAAVSPDRRTGMGLDFARMAHCRPVVGYANDIDPAQIDPQVLLARAQMPEETTQESFYPLSVWHQISNSVIDSIDENRLKRMRPWFTMMLVLQSLVKELHDGPAAPGMDMALAQLSREAGVSLAALETTEQQVDALASIDDATIAQMITQTLQGGEGLEDLQGLLEAYRSGDYDRVTGVLEEMQEATETPEFHEKRPA